MTTGMADMKELYDAGAHVALARTRRHPTATAFVHSTKDRVDIFNLEETARRLNSAIEFVKDLARSGKSIVFLGGKHEVQDIIRSAATRIGVPHVAGRWIGGTLTNFKNIRKRVDRLEKLMEEREKGELEKYTKRERLLIDREIEELLNRFGGIVNLRDLPGALFIVDTRHEDTVVREAKQMHVPVVALASSDCDFSLIQYPIPANDTSVRSVRFIVEQVADAYVEGKKVASAKAHVGDK